MDYSNVLATSNALTRFGASAGQVGSDTLPYESNPEYSDGSCAACGRNMTFSQFSQIERAQAGARHYTLLTDHVIPTGRMEADVAVGSHPAHQYGTRRRSTSRVPPAKISFRYTDTRERQPETLILSFSVPQAADSTSARAEAFAQSAELVGRLDKDALLGLYQIQNDLYHDNRSYSQLALDLFQAGARVSIEEPTADRPCRNGAEMAIDHEVQLGLPGTELSMALPAGPTFTRRRRNLSTPGDDNDISGLLPSQRSHEPYTDGNESEGSIHSPPSMHSLDGSARISGPTCTEGTSLRATRRYPCYSPLGRPTIWTPTDQAYLGT